MMLGIGGVDNINNNINKIYSQKDKFLTIRDVKALSKKFQRHLSSGTTWAIFSTTNTPIEFTTQSFAALCVQTIVETNRI